MSAYTHTHTHIHIYFYLPLLFSFLKSSSSLLVAISLCLRPREYIKRSLQRKDVQSRVEPEMSCTTASLLRNSISDSFRKNQWNRNGCRCVQWFPRITSTWFNRNPRLLMFFRQCESAAKHVSFPHTRFFPLPMRLRDFYLALASNWSISRARWISRQVPSLTLTVLYQAFHISKLLINGFRQVPIRGCSSFETSINEARPHIPTGICGSTTTARLISLVVSSSKWPSALPRAS